LPAGFARMRPVRFGLYTLAGCALWTLGLGWAGYAVGASWQSVAAAFHGPAYVIGGITGALIVIALIVLGRRRRRERAASARAVTEPRPPAALRSSRGQSSRSPG
jgi:membrane protein DedA with SNARE-associated domain